MSERFAGEWIWADYAETRPGHLGHRRRMEKVVRCRDCDHCDETPKGLACGVHGEAGWFATEPEGFCHLAKEKEEGR